MTWPFVRTVIERDLVDSTSDLARALVMAGGIELPLLVHARRQSRGRGRGTNLWWSGEGSLTFTLAISAAQHGVEASHEPRLALVAALAILDAVGPMVANRSALGIRWPNDVESGGRKLAGVLPEKVETRDLSHVFLLGIGVNLSPRWELAPPEIRRLAVSVRDLAPEASDADLEPDRIIGGFLAGLNSHLANLQRDPSDLADCWRTLDALKGRPVRVDLGTEIITGIGAGIDDDGALLVATERSVVRLFGGRVLREK